jgi:hypothetical protein
LRRVATMTLFRHAFGCAQEASAGAVVATDRVSTDADRDNGTVLHSAAQFRRSYDLAVKRLGAQEGNERRPPRFLSL